MEDILTTDLIDGKPSEWRLNMRIEPNSELEVMLFAPARRDKFIYRRLPLNDMPGSPLKALEDTIYTHPLLTCGEFNHVDCIIGSLRVTPLPSPLKASVADIDAVITEPGVVNAFMLFRPGREMAAFLKRTFPDIQLHATLPTLCRYFTNAVSRSNGFRMLVNYRKGAIDVLVLNHSRLVMCNSFDVVEPSDAAYYIMACRRLLHLDAERDPLYSCGTSELMAATDTFLLKFDIRSLPVIFPSEIFESEHHTRNASFDLIALTAEKDVI